MIYKLFPKIEEEETLTTFYEDINEARRRHGKKRKLQTKASDVCGARIHNEILETRFIKELIQRGDEIKDVLESSRSAGV